MDNPAVAARVATYGLPKLTGYVITRWHSDPLAKGSWTYFAPGSSPADYAEVAAPEGGLFFAGEHTCLQAQGTAHGAFVSGRAAGKAAVASLAMQ